MTSNDKLKARLDEGLEVGVVSGCCKPWTWQGILSYGISGASNHCSSGILVSQATPAGDWLDGLSAIGMSHTSRCRFVTYCTVLYSLYCGYLHSTYVHFSAPSLSVEDQLRLLFVVDRQCAWQ